MKQVAMGMAGHVDHGKTALVCRLTGVDTDRLEEEKRRGMTIELGFAPFCLPDGTRISIIDVPGHERFIKAMVAGAMGIDLVLLVVAADEGIMPQTREHLDIITLLGINRGVVALTKTDLVDTDWQDMVREEILDFLKPSSLAGAPIVPVSAKTGWGIPRLVGAIASEAGRASLEMADDVFRLAVDRVFVAEGYGIIVTGTVYGGSLQRGCKVMVFPHGLEARVRSMQVHGKDVDMVIAGERCALNLVGIDTGDVKRGDTIAYPGELNLSSRLDCLLTSVPNAPLIDHGQRVRVHLGTREVLARIHLIGEDRIAPGTKGYVQLKTEEPIVALRGDHYIIRSYSPMITIGGGQILMSGAPRRRRFSLEDRQEMELLAQGSTQEVLGVILRRRQPTDGAGIAPITPQELARLAHMKAVSLNEALESDGWVPISGKYLPKPEYEMATGAVERALREVYCRSPFRLGIDREELKSTLFLHWGRKEYGALLKRLADEEKIVMDGRWVGDPKLYRQLQRVEHPALLRLEADILDQGYQGYPQDGVISGKESSDTADMLALLVHFGKVVDVGYGLFIHKHTLDEAWRELKQHLVDTTSITVAEFRDRLEISRKMAVALLEYFDRLQLTRRQGDQRVVGPRF
ncbi:MAG: selenocysteine-specific translation elongation factor [Firmicutes bacterium]|jgi:selenocysteine-specific elongation factor|nr:selenocysteine-specific translation elongation factor [Bacillota bacterium]